MKTIAFHLQKGGVGKTTLSGTIAHSLKSRGKTLLVDVDPQANSTSWFLTTAPKFELADVLQGNATVSESIVSSEGIDILPSFGLDGTLKVYGENKLSDEPFIFCDLAEELKSMKYDFVIFDLSPSFGKLEKSALLACNEVITPMTPEFFSLDGIEIFSNELNRLAKNFRKAPAHNKIIVNSFDARIAQHIEIRSKISELNYTVFTIPVDPVFRKSQAAHCSPQDFGSMKNETISSLNVISNQL